MKNIFYIEDYHYYKKPISDDNPYWCCKNCDISDPEINGNLLEHQDDCLYKENILKELKINKNMIISPKSPYLLSEQDYKIINKNGYNIFMLI